MLQTLHIENIAVIKSADIDFERGFTVLSGETGAGKSILIDSVNLLLGNRMSQELIRNGEDVATVSVIFSCLPERIVSALSALGINAADNEIMLSRTISRDGRSVARVDGRVVTLGLLREISGMLVSIHGQNDSQRFFDKSAHILLIDSYAKNDKLLADYADVYSRLQSAKSELSSLNANEAEQNRLKDILEYQIKEIESAKLKSGEEEALETEKKKLLNIEKISKQVRLSYKILHGADGGSVTYLLDRAAGAIKQIADVIPEAEELSERLTDYRYEILDIAETVDGFADDTSGDPTARLDKIEDRLYLISKLKKKYGNSVDEIIAFCDNAREKLDAVENSDTHKAKLEDKIAQLYREAYQIAEKLSEKRKSAAADIQSGVTESLEFLDMPNVRFEISVEKLDKLKSDGFDDLEFMIATNKGEPLMPMTKIASGGELSRIMLSLKSVISDREGTPTVIYDEVDSGISGKTSRKVGIKLKETSKDSQIVCVTHSAQIASLADTHKKIIKSEIGDRTETSVITLDEGGRVEEIARILGGINITDTQRSAAREMIDEGRNY